MIYSPIYDEWGKGLPKSGLYLDTIYRLIDEPSIKWFENVREIDTSEEFILEASIAPVDAPTRRQFLNDDRGREQMLHSNLKKLILNWPREKIYNHDLEIFEFDGMLQNFYDALEVGVPREKILLVLHTHDDDFIKNKLTELNINFIEIDYFELDAYHRLRNGIEVNNVDDVSFSNRLKDKYFLTLNGKPWKWSRMGLMIKLWKENILQNGYGSLIRTFGDKKNFKSKRDYYYDNISQYYRADRVRDVLSEEEWLEFVNYWNKNLRRTDSELDLKTGVYGHHYSGYPFDVSLYRNTLFSIVVETHSGDKQQGDGDLSYFLTEKTARAIINSHPFLMVSTKGFLKNLTDRGYENYPMFDNSYDDVDSFDERLDLIINQVTNFDDSKIEESLEIAKHNKQNLIDRSKKQSKELLDVIIR